MYFEERSPSWPWMTGLSAANLKGNHQLIIPAMFCLSWFSGFREEYLLKADDGRRRMPTDGNCSHDT